MKIDRAMSITMGAKRKIDHSFTSKKVKTSTCPLLRNDVAP